MKEKTHILKNYSPFKIEFSYIIWQAQRQDASCFLNIDIYSYISSDPNFRKSAQRSEGVKSMPSLECGTCVIHVYSVPPEGTAAFVRILIPSLVAESSFYALSIKFN